MWIWLEMTFLIIIADEYDQLITNESYWLWQQMELETQQFLQERSERIRLLHERQDRELEQFDEESARLGFRLVSFLCY